MDPETLILALAEIRARAPDEEAAREAASRLLENLPDEDAPAE